MSSQPASPRKVKQAVQISKKIKTKYRFQKLKICKKCHTYSVLMDDTCPDCGQPYTSFETLAKSIFKNNVLTEAILIMIFVSVGIILAPTMASLYYSLIAGSVFCLAYVTFAFIYKNSEYFMSIKKLLVKDFNKIQSGIEEDSERAKADVEEEQYKVAYEKIREINDFLQQDEIKIRGIMLLNEIVLRKDMELEIESFVPRGYNKAFIQYVLDVQKVNNTLVTKKVIAYFITYQKEILRDFGREVLISIAGNALRMKLYIMEFSDFIQDFLSYLPKERVLRLCTIIHKNPEENWGKLADKTKQVVKNQYSYDPDFKAFL